MLPRTIRPAFCVDAFMWTGAIMASLALALAGHAQDAKQSLIGHVKALAAANTDATRDSISVLLKQELRGFLEAPDGLSAPMDDVPLSRVEAPDGSFRLITWNLPHADGTYHYEGFLLAKRGKRTNLFELRDASAAISSPELAELGPDRWLGALYYQVIPVKKGGRTWYTLLGWKGVSNTETHKVIDVLSFRGDKPRFGAPLFGSGKLKQQRKVFAFAFQSSMMLHYEAGEDRIVLDHLSPVRPDMEGQPAFTGPDMSFDAFVWDKGRWTYERDIDLRDPRQGGRFNAPPPAPRP